MDSVTFVLPVQNAQSSLPAKIDYLIDAMSDQYEAFSIVIEDRTSTDETYDIAIELATQIPQVFVTHASLQNSALPASMHQVQALAHSETRWLGCLNASHTEIEETLREPALVSNNRSPIEFSSSDQLSIDDPRWFESIELVDSNHGCEPEETMATSDQSFNSLARFDRRHHAFPTSSHGSLDLPEPESSLPAYHLG